MADDPWLSVKEEVAATLSQTDQLYDRWKQLVDRPDVGGEDELDWVGCHALPQCLQLEPVRRPWVSPWASPWARARRRSFSCSRDDAAAVVGIATLFGCGAPHSCVATAAG